MDLRQWTDPSLLGEGSRRLKGGLGSLREALETQDQARRTALLADADGHALVLAEVVAELDRRGTSTEA